MVETGYRVKYIRTLNTVLVCILACALFAFVTPVAAAAVTTVSVSSVASVYPGDNFTASIKIVDVTGFDAAQYDVTYDPTVIQVISVDKGLIGGLEIPVDMWASINSTTIRVINNIRGIQNLSGTGYLAKIHFQVVGAVGTSSNIILSNGLLGDKDAKEITPVDWQDGSVKVISSGSGGDDGGGGGGGGGGGSGTTSLSEYTTGEGKFVIEATAESADRLVWILIPKNTIARDRNGGRLRFISIKENSTAPSPPADRDFVCLAYNIGPSGTTFNPPAYLYFRYSDSHIPPGIDENKLVIATEQDGKWIELNGCTIDPVTKTIKVLISHLSMFTVLARTAPASFEISEMNITPDEVYPDEMVTIRVNVTNAGDMVGSKNITLKLNGIEVQTQTVTLDGGESLTVNFIATPDESGEYTVDINGYPGEFTVSEPEGAVAEVVPPSPGLASFTISDLLISPVEVYPSEEVTISALVNNIGGSEGTYTVILKVGDIEEVRNEITLEPGTGEKLYFSTTKNEVGSYAIDVNGQTGRFTVIPKPPPAGPTETETAEPTKSVLPTIIIFISLIIVAAILIFSYRKLSKPKDSTL